MEDGLQERVLVCLSPHSPRLDGPLAVSLVRPDGNRISFGEGADFCLAGDVREWAGVPAAELRPKIEVFAEALDQLGRLEIPTLKNAPAGAVRRGSGP